MEQKMRPRNNLPGPDDTGNHRDPFTSRGAHSASVAYVVFLPHLFFIFASCLAAPPFLPSLAAPLKEPFRRRARGAQETLFYPQDLAGRADLVEAQKENRSSGNSQTSINRGGAKQGGFIILVWKISQFGFVVNVL